MLNRADYNFVVKYGEVTPDGVAVYDLNSRNFVYMNRFLKHMLGLAESEHPKSGEVLQRLVHPDDLEYVEHRYRELLSIGCIAPAEFRVKQEGKGSRFLQAEVLWLEESYTFALFVKDITRAREHEDFLVKISAQKDTLLDMLLHNLSGPLYLSRDMIHLLAEKEQGQGGGDNDKLIALMKETTAQCIDLVRQFLADEHAESAETVVKKNRFDIFAKSSIVVDQLRELNKKKHFDLRIDLQDHYVWSDPVKYFQILHNLLSNAVKYTQEDGHIRVLISGKNGHVDVQVADDGIGVAEELRDRLFEGKVEGRRGLRGERSQGLGLMLCQRLVDTLGGSIGYEPGEEKGSKFHFRIPNE